ncbi:MAG: circularly permuted type 2 ATP-grasp protein [Treponema sp.]|jgi:uncharacterized circularly permuted ATP-grasp superfamily protein|nr:circularly permuted type 2 ATP-grasp protein [Treponema sp.]
MEGHIIIKWLVQRSRALNAFLLDIYNNKYIVRDKIITGQFIYSSKGRLPQCEGVVPPKKIYAHIAGIDLVQAEDDSWIVLEDNLRIPSGSSYPRCGSESVDCPRSGAVSGHGNA